MVDEWGWEPLSDIYKRSPYLCEYSGSSAPDNSPSEVTPDSSPGEADNSCFIDEMMSITELPVKNIYVIVIPQYEYNTLVITQVRGIITSNTNQPK